MKKRILSLLLILFIGASVLSSPVMAAEEKVGLKAKIVRIFEAARKRLAQIGKGRISADDRRAHKKIESRTESY